MSNLEFQKNQTFKVENNDDAIELNRLAIKIADKGVIEWNHPFIVNWLSNCPQYNQYNKLLIASTIMPMKFFQSVASYSIQYLE